MGSSGALPPGVYRRSLRVRARSCSCKDRSEKTSSDEDGQQRTGAERDLTSGTGGERERQEETKRDLRQDETVHSIDEQSDTTSNSEQKRESDISPDQTPYVRVLLYCFKPPQPRAAASPPPRQAVGACLGRSILRPQLFRSVGQ